MRKNMTPWEAKLWYQFLRHYNVRFQRQKVIDHYIVDFYCAKAKLIVELDGGGHYDPKAEKEDLERTVNLEKYGLKVIRFCNLDIDKNFYGVRTVIDEEVRNRVSPSLREVDARSADGGSGASYERTLPQSANADSPLREGARTKVL